ncbi:uncharacterized protein A4U43_C10F5440 [Asparagus officinalis]|uniref:DYW domain-containing protein n=2 Tax=Asparagus officinalis TaxID=4686 RepID=A0A5P1E163_ASPOF|nr:uncharacterized protein A4U43_C10F5440 [Asparagus officinalis]
MKMGFDLVALELLYEMVGIGIGFNKFTFSMALTLAGKLVLLELGKQIHSQILRNGCEYDAFITTSLLDMYCKCGKIEASLVVFYNSSQSTDGLIAKTIQWSSMISGFVQNGRIEEALKLFSKMLQKGLKVDKFTLTSISSACSDAGILQQGRQIHACIEKLGYGFDVFSVSAITDMYAKCGSLDDACRAFDSIESRNVVIWTSMINSYASHGHGRKAIQLFEKMLGEKIMPNEITFVGVLSACSHCGEVKEGCKYFRLMQEEYGIFPSIEHFTCMVDLLGRAGKLEEAKDFIYQNNIEHHDVVWKALLASSRFDNNIEMAKWASEQLVSLKPKDVGSYVLISNICATKRMFLESNKLRNLMRERGMSKEPGQSWIELKNKVHVFTVDDKSHPESEAIYSYLEHLMERLKELGHKENQC